MVGLLEKSYFSLLAVHSLFSAALWRDAATRAARVPKAALQLAVATVAAVRCPWLVMEEGLMEEDTAAEEERAAVMEGEAEEEEGVTDPEALQEACIQGNACTDM